jgi:UDP-N-acetylglucosamine 2-epimerase (non-hydrolysing)
VHGDTTGAGGSAAFYAGCRIGHVRLGCALAISSAVARMNRSVVDRLADRLFAPTTSARASLLKENVAADKIVVTGNTVIDALFAVRAALEGDATLRRSADAGFGFLDPAKKLILVTGHRRESFGHGFDEICAALHRIAQRDDVQIVYPVHLNPSVQAPVRRMLGGLPNVHLLEPQGYVPFVHLMMRSHIVLTDSGGIQEEAPSLGKPVLVMRAVTERPEAVAAGTVALVGTDRERIHGAVAELLDQPARYAAFTHAHNPYGDGLASGASATRCCAMPPSADAGCRVRGRPYHPACDVRSHPWFKSPSWIAPRKSSRRGSAISPGMPTSW